MRHPEKPDLERRLDTYFATLHSPSLKEILKRSAANWRLYAAVTGSAVAVATGASAPAIGESTRTTRLDPVASMRATQHFTSSQRSPLTHAIRLAMAGQNPAARVFRPAALQAAHAVQAPSISPGGIVPIYGSENIIQPGEWVSIYGTNLASGTQVWSGDFPTSLGGTSVLIDGKLAYLSFVSPNQINLQAPNDRATGTVPVIVTTRAGSGASTVTLAPFAPSFCLIAVKGKAGYVAGIIVRSDGTGAYGGGSYDILGPTGNVFGYPTVAARPGDIVELFGVGFGPTTPVVPAGVPFTGAAPTNARVHLYINEVSVDTLWTGISGAGLYQINLIVPSGLGEGDVPVEAFIAGKHTESAVVFPLEGIPGGGGGYGGGTSGTFVPPPGGSSFNPGTPGTGGGTWVGTGGGGTVGTGGGTNGGGTNGGTNGGGTGGGGGGGTGGGGGGGTGGGGGGGTGGGGGSGGGGGTGGSAIGPRARHKKPYVPRLQFTPKTNPPVTGHQPPPTN